MSDDGLAIWIMLIAILISITGISATIQNQDKKDCPDCPNHFDMQTNSTTRVTIDNDNKRECIEQYPFGYYHEIRNNKCSFVIWTNDLYKNVTELNRSMKE